MHFKDNYQSLFCLKLISDRISLLCNNMDNLAHAMICKNYVNCESIQTEFEALYNEIRILRDIYHVEKQIRTSVLRKKENHNICSIRS